MYHNNNPQKNEIQKSPPTPPQQPNSQPSNDTTKPEPSPQSSQPTHSTYPTTSTTTSNFISNIQSQLTQSIPPQTTFYKLFVGQLPFTISEPELTELFQPFGELQEVTIIRDRFTGQHRGCAFVTFKQQSAADKAIDAFHNKKTLLPVSLS